MARTSGVESSRRRRAAPSSTVSRAPVAAHHGELHDEACSAMESFIEGDGSVHRFDEPAADGQTEPRALAHVFGGDEGLEEARGDLRIDPRSVVFDDQANE